MLVWSGAAANWHSRRPRGERDQFASMHKLNIHTVSERKSLTTFIFLAIALPGDHHTRHSCQSSLNRLAGASAAMTSTRGCLKTASSASWGPWTTTYRRWWSRSSSSSSQSPARNQSTCTSTVPAVSLDNYLKIYFTS